MSKQKIILSTVAVVGSILAIYFIYDHFTFVTTDNAQVEAPTVMLASKVPGFIAAVEVSEGQRVKKGDVLLQIDDRDYQNSVSQLKAELSSLEAKRKDTETNFHRLKDLFSKGAISRQGYDTAQTQYLETKSKYDALSAQTAQAQLNLENTKVRAPQDGSIAKKSAELGQFASPGVPLIGFVGDKDRWVTANFKETDLESIRLGAPVEMTVDAISSRTFTGKWILSGARPELRLRFFLLTMPQETSRRLSSEFR